MLKTEIAIMNAANHWESYAGEVLFDSSEAALIMIVARAVRQSDREDQKFTKSCKGLW